MFLVSCSAILWRFQSLETDTPVGVRELLGPVLKRGMADFSDFFEIEQILHHVRNLLFIVYLETTLLKGKSIHAFQELDLWSRD